MKIIYILLICFIFVAFVSFVVNHHLAVIPRSPRFLQNGIFTTKLTKCTKFMKIIYILLICFIFVSFVVVLYPHPFSCAVLSPV